MAALTELKPCPFCGGDANARQHEECPEINIAGCADPDCIGSAAAYDFASLEEAVEAWNTRVSPAAINALVEALRETRVDLSLMVGSVRNSLHHDLRWEGMPEVINGWMQRIDAALSAFEQEGRL